jgi:hypothetical protein
VDRDRLIDRVEFDENRAIELAVFIGFRATERARKRPPPASIAGPASFA